jgi:hypothetical protein
VSAVQTVASERGSALPELAPADTIRSGALLFQKHTIETSVITTNKEKEELSLPLSRSRRVGRLVGGSSGSSGMVSRGLCMEAIPRSPAAYPPPLRHSEVCLLIATEGRGDSFRHRRCKAHNTNHLESPASIDFDKCENLVRDQGPEVQSALPFACKGVVAAICQFLIAHNGSVSHSDDHLDSGRDLFLSRLECDLNGFDIPIPDFEHHFKPVADPFRIN